MWCFIFENIIQGIIMIYLKGILLILTMMAVCYMAGEMLIRLLRLELKGVCCYITVGFCGLLALFQLISFPIQRMKGSLNIVLIIFVMVVVAIVSSYFLQYPLKNFKINKDNIRLKVIVILLIAFQAISCVAMYHADDDDGYYVVASSYMIETNTLETDEGVVTSGLQGSAKDRIDTATWEIFVAVLSCAFKIHPTVLAHMILPLVLIPISYMAFYSIGTKLFIDDKDCEKKTLIFLFFLSFLNLFGGYCVYSTGCFLLLRLWQGKAVFANIIMPILLRAVLEIIYGNECIKNFIYIAIILISGICVSVIGVYLLPIYYIVLGIPYIIYKIFKKKRWYKLLINATLSLVPSMIFAFIALFSVLTKHSNYMNETPYKYYDVLERTVLQGLYVPLFITSLLYCVLKSKKEQKIFFIGSTICLFSTFLNPLLSELVAQKITGVYVYWRLYWLIPIYYGIAYFMTEIIFIMKKHHIIATIAFVFIIILSGDYIFMSPYYYPYTNTYKLPNEVLEIADYINSKNGSKEKVCIFLPKPLAAKIRQYSLNFLVPVSRDSYQSDFVIPNTDIAVVDFWKYLYSEEDLDMQYVYAQFDNLDVEYWVKEDDGYIYDSDRLDFVKNIGNYQLYHYLGYDQENN